MLSFFSDLVSVFGFYAAAAAAAVDNDNVLVDDVVAVVVAVEGAYSCAMVPSSSLSSVSKKLRPLLLDAAGRASVSKKLRPLLDLAVAPGRKMHQLRWRIWKRTEERRTKMWRMREFTEQTEEINAVRE